MLRMLLTNSKDFCGVRTALDTSMQQLGSIFNDHDTPRF
jgi:hypothetical protein